MTGTVHLVGAGPGAPDLLTLRAARLLAEADIVFHDALVHPDTLALAARAEKIAVGKRCGRHSTAQRFINKRLIDAARNHQVVVRLKGGDPMLFGRAQEEINALVAAGISVSVVPGVTAALAASADLRQSLTQRGVSRSVAFVTPRVGADAPARTGNRAPDGAWADAAAAADTAVIYMGAKEAAAVSAALIARGKPAGLPVAVVENASLPDQRTLPTTLGALAQTVADLGNGPALLLIGEVYAALAALPACATRRVA
jgi:uroporphyrin-III C-methyltransferase